MFHVLLTCPRDLLCLLGVTIVPPPQRLDTVSAVAAALQTLGGSVRRSTNRFAVTLADPADAVLALGTLRRALRDYRIELSSVVASEAAVELLSDATEPLRSAWQAVRTPVPPKGNRYAPPPPDPMADDPFADARGFGACVHFGEALVRWPLPDEIATQELPTAPGLVLWWVDERKIVHVDRDPFLVGRGADCDLRVESDYVSRKHVEFARTDETWRCRDLGSAGGFNLNNYRAGDHQLLQAGMVIQFARPTAFVVLAII